MEPIQLFVPTFHIDECLNEIRECLDKGWTGLGYKTVQFEQAWNKYTGLPHSHFVNSATAGLHLAVKLLKDQRHWRDGDEIITTPLTFVSTNHAILYERLTPVFADVDQYLCLDPDSVYSRLTSKTRAVMFVGMGGNVGQLRDIVELCKQHGLALILDAAHMSGTQYEGRHVGSEADITVFSYQAVKNLPTADSGMLCCQDDALDVRARKLTWLGIDKDTYTRTNSNGTYKWYYDVPEVGFKYHSNSIMASLALVGLKHLDDDNRYRRMLCAHYDRYLMDAPLVKPVPIAPYCVPSRHLYQVLVRDRNRVVEQLNQAGIYPGVHYIDNRIYRMYAEPLLNCPNAMTASGTVISLPLHLRLTTDDVKRVATTLKEITDANPSSSIYDLALETSASATAGTR